MKFMTGFIENFILIEKFADICVTIAAGSKKLKSFLHIPGSILVNFYFFVNIQVNKLRLIRPFAAAEFLSVSSFYIFGKIIHIILTLAKSNIKHEFSLRRILKPKRRKF